MPPFFARARRALTTLLLGSALAVVPSASTAQEADPSTRPATPPVCRERVGAVSGPVARAWVAAQCLLEIHRTEAVPADIPTDEPPEVAPPPPATALPAPATAPPACPPVGVDALPLEKIVTEVFRCRLREAGRSEEEVRRVAAEALVVATCESYLDPNMVVFGGRWRDTPHPNGNRYTAAGLFQFVRWTADKFVEGGYELVHDPVRNSDAAARLYLFNADRAGRPGWIDWACAAVNDGFTKRSVLPGWPGGPAELPAWAWEH